ncbi:hypothetical protein AWL63_24215 (plasmid) [Sphingomonas panacis]|uniref:Uncharacterized protein n=2 Tax=Sphingomonas panacis TaxID=1560345 RepID=A0A1B3ZIS1_9SPHN|nr:hypothetical protein AWL63_24215 [Sphingomonas panacis]
MTVVELAIFIAVYRAAQPIGADVLSNILGRWFESVVGPDDIAGAVTNMVERGWLVMIGGRLMATQDGRRVASHLMNGVIRMLDQGTRLIDVALMMSVLRLTKGELDNGNL